MAATGSIDGKAVAAGGARRVARRGRSARSPRRPDAGARDGAGRRRPASHDLRAQQAQGLRGGRASRRSTTSLAADVAQDELAELIEELNADDAVRRDPAPAAAARPHRPGRVVALIDPRKDVDGLTPANAGLLVQGRAGLVPCTPAGRDGAAAHGGRRARGRRGGRRRPLEAGRASRWRRCCSRANATVTICHSRTRDLAAVCRRADVLVAAVGSAAPASTARHGEARARP